MRNILITFTVFLLSPVFVHAENIESFVSDIEIKEDASFTVTETIDYRFSEERHGIFRIIPLAHPDKPSAFYKERIIDIDLKDVRMDGKEVPYALESTKDQFNVRIGDPDSTISGAHIYTITYDVHGGLSYPPGEGVELYWNATGNEWPVSIRVAEVTLHSKEGIFRSVRSCYRGTFGSTSGSCAVTQKEDGSILFRTTNLNDGEGITVAQSLDVARIPRDIRERTNFWWFIIPLGIIGLLYGVFRIYSYKTANKTGRTIIPEYEPYPDTKPMYAGLLMDGRLDSRDITAGIVYLAEQGYLKIRKTERKVLFLFDVDDYEITLHKLPDETLGGFEEKIIELLFDQPFEVGMTISLSSLKSDRSEQQKNYVAFKALEEELRKDLIASGFYEQFRIQKILTLFLAILAVAVAVGFLITGTISVGIIWATIIMGGITAALVNRRRTRQGYEALDHLEGFKLFLEMTDRDRFAFHNAPEKSPEQFMEYLPYAIAFGVEKAWAKTFEGITIQNPEWYDGGSVGSFSSTNLSSSLGAFSTAFASTGASASSGGGSSGGGAGGGGGGSW